MPDNWIGNIRLTNEEGIIEDGVEVDAEKYPQLHAELPALAYLPL